MLVQSARRFYADHPDAFDMLVFWGGPQFGPGHSFYLPVRNDTEGLGYSHFGRDLFDDSREFGSDRLQGVIWMGPSWRTKDANAGDPKSALATLAHETAHRWGASVHFLDQGKPSSALLSGTTHWSFFLHTDGSPLGGNQWEHLGGSRFRAAPAAITVFSPLDLYLMGLMAADQVPPLLMLSGLRTQNGPPDTRFRPDSVSATGEILVFADATYVDIAQVIAAEGLRSPTGFSAANIRQAWVYVADDLDRLSLEHLASLEHLRERWPAFFRFATHGRGAVDTTLEGG